METKRFHQTQHLRSFWMILLLALVLLLAACGGSTTATPPAPTATTPPTPTATTPPTPTAQTTQATAMKVNIVENDEKYSFQPAMITIKAGTQVVWTNTSDAPHTVTSDNGAFSASSVIQKHNTFSMTFTKPGTYQYHCSIHPYMTATVVVTS